MRAVTRLRELLAGPEAIVSLGCHDVLSALLAEQAGLETVFCGGFGTAASLLGLPDLNLLTQTEMADAVRRMAARLTIPVIADGDTGHGELPQVERTVRLFEQAGAAGILLEDQLAPKRCGHFEHKQVGEAGAMVRKLKVALAARSDPEFVLLARTDARAEHGLDEAIDRANLYGDTGADVVFIEAPESLAELEAMAARVRYPQLLNLLVGGKTPILSVAEAGAMGFKIVVAPIETLLAAAAAVKNLIVELKQAGRLDHLPPERLLSFAEIKSILGLPRYLALGAEE